MSVPKNKRSQGKLTVIVKAYQFASYTHEICSNEKVFLKRNRWCSTMKIADTADDIAIYCELANECDVRNEEGLNERKRLQQLALQCSSKAETLMEIAYRDNNRKKQNLLDDKFEYWVGLLVELRTLIRKWRDSVKGNH